MNDNLEQKFGAVPPPTLVVLVIQFVVCVVALVLIEPPFVVCVGILQPARVFLVSSLGVVTTLVLNGVDAKPVDTFRGVIECGYKALHQ